MKKLLLACALLLFVLFALLPNLFDVLAHSTLGDGFYRAQLGRALEVADSIYIGATVGGLMVWLAYVFFPKVSLIKRLIVTAIIQVGLLAGIVCLWGVTGLKRLIGADDSLDVFGVHGVGGILGAILTGVFCDPALGGTGVWDYVANAVGEYNMAGQVTSQLWGVGVAIVWSGVVSVIAYKLVDMFIGLRVPEEEEREGLDITSHGESAYHH